MISKIIGLFKGGYHRGLVERKANWWLQCGATWDGILAIVHYWIASLWRMACRNPVRVSLLFLSIPPILAIIISINLHKEAGSFVKIFKEHNICSLINEAMKQPGISTGYTMLGTILACAIFWSLRKQSSRTVKDFMEIMIDMIAEAGVHEKIVIVTPVFAFGQRYPALRDLLWNSFKNALDGGTKITWYCLHFDLIAYFGEIGKEACTCRSSCWSNGESNPHIKYLRNFSTWKKGDDSISGIASLDSAFELPKKMREEYSDNFVLDACLKETYLNANFFAVANLASGVYYMGSFKDLANDSEFHGTRFENLHITKQVETMLKSFVKEHS